MNVMVFDFETIPDIKAGRCLLENEAELSDAMIAETLFEQRKQQTKSTFLPHYLHQIVSISVVLKTEHFVKVWSLAEEESTECDLIERFFEGLKKYKPMLVSWNGSGFDLPVLHYRALLHGICAQEYWDVGHHDPQFKWNNYLNRYHYRHLDLMDVLSAYHSRASAPLDQLSCILGFPGKMGESGSKVWTQYQAGELSAIRNYCETDVLNTYLVYLRFEKMRGILTKKAYDTACDLLKQTLESDKKPHLNAFLSTWQEKERG
jgi:3'-5' exonuclease